MPFRAPTTKVPTSAEVAAEIAASMERAKNAVAESLQKLGPLVDRDPRGLDPVILAATLRAFADVLEMRFGEGNEMGPLKTLVDDFRKKIVLALQGR